MPGSRFAKNRSVLQSACKLSLPLPKPAKTRQSAAMDPKYYGLIEMVMMFAIVGGFTAWTFWSLREKPQEKNKKKDDSEDS